jgi:hypothetical protein
MQLEAVWARDFDIGAKVFDVMIMSFMAGVLNGR